MTDNLADKLKELIDKNGPGYLYDQPYKTYQALIEANPKEEKTAGAILLALVRGIKEEVVKQTD